MADPRSPRLDAEERLQSLRGERDQWRPHWAELAQYILPRRYRWLTTPNQARGGNINSRMLDSTATIAFRTLGSGMMSGITSPSRPWFKLRISGFGPAADSQAVAVWLDECQQRMLAVFAESNFYEAMAIKFFDLGVFGTSAMLMYEDFEDVILCENPCLGEFLLGNDSRGRPSIFAREFTMTPVQIERRFRQRALPQMLRTALDRRGASLAQEWEVCHLIEPDPTNRRMPFRERYWLKAASHDEGFLEEKRYYENPAMCARWDLSGNDSYGRSPGMDALGDVKQLQQQQKRKAQGIDKVVNPPLVASSVLKNQPATTLPGGITYVDGMRSEAPGLRPLYQVAPDLQALTMDIKETQSRIQTIAFNDLFLMISQLDTVRTATEIDARREEKLIQLGPVLERFENEVLDPAVNRTFQIMLRGGLLPQAPPEAEGEFIHVDYVSMLAEAQRATATASIERSLQLSGNLAAVDPTIMDVYDLEETVREYNFILSAPPRMLRDPKAVAAIREQRAQTQQQEQLLQQTVAGAQGAKTLSQTDLGGGVNALQAALGTGGAPA